MAPIFRTSFSNAFFYVKLISIKISLKFVPKGPNNNITASVQIMAGRRGGDKPSSAPMLISLLTHIWVTRPKWICCSCHPHDPLSRHSLCAIGALIRERCYIMLYPVTMYYLSDWWSDPWLHIIAYGRYYIPCNNIWYIQYIYSIIKYLSVLSYRCSCMIRMSIQRKMASMNLKLKQFMWAYNIWNQKKYKQTCGQ